MINQPGTQSADHTHISHMWRVAIILSLITIVVFLSNRQWLKENVLVNSPSFDSLVYQNQSYDDYHLLRDKGPVQLYRKYTDGRWHVPPLFMLSGTLSYLILGMDPANFYILPTFCFFVILFATYGFTHLFTRRFELAALAACLVAFTPSTVSFGLRVSQTDFAVGAFFALSTYLLAASGGLQSRKGALLYAVASSITLLVKASIAPYFMAHVIIWGLYVAFDRESRADRVKNAFIMAAAVLAMIGWFYFNNIGQIIRYYTEWGASLSSVTKRYAGINSRLDEWLFYLKSFYAFHLRQHVMMSYILPAAGSFIVWLAIVVVSKNKRSDREFWGILTAIVWIAIPYIILSLYQSKAYSVDFPFMPVFYIMPVLCVSALFRLKPLSMLAPVVIFGALFVNLGHYQMNNFFMGSVPADWKEKEILRDVFDDASSRGLNEVTLGNAFIHKYLTSENMKYFVVNGTFAKWIGSYHVLSIGYFNSAEEYYRRLAQADYVLAKSGKFLPQSHPDNVLASAVNEMLGNSVSFEIIGKYLLPDASYITLYRNQGIAHISHPRAMDDGWVGPGFPIDFIGNVRKVRLAGKIYLPADDMFPATLFLENESGDRVMDVGVVKEDGAFEIVFDVSSLTSGQKGKTTLFLNSDRIHSPANYNLSGDTRKLMLLLDTLEAAPNE